MAALLMAVLAVLEHLDEHNFLEPVSANASSGTSVKGRQWSLSKPAQRQRANGTDSHLQIVRTLTTKSTGGLNFGFLVFLVAFLGFSGGVWLSVRNFLGGLEMRELRLDIVGATSLYQGCLLKMAV